MRVFTRIALTLAVSVVLATAAVASHFEADCPMRLVASTPAVTAFFQSPHGVFRFGNLLFVLEGQALTTYTVTELGDLSNQTPRQDFIGTLGGRETAGGVAFANGFLYISSDAGLEIFDLRNVRPGGSAPTLASRTPGLHYRRLAVSGLTLAGVFPATDFPCFIGGPTPNCINSVDLFNVSNPSAPVLVSSIASNTSSIGGFNDVAFNFGVLIVTGQNGTAAFNVANAAAPAFITAASTPGTFLVSNGATFVAVGSDTSILTFNVSVGTGLLTPMFLHTIATLRMEHSNPIQFHPQGTFDEAGTRLIMMVDELDPQTLRPARTFAFDTFDYGVPMFEGRDPRQYEQVSYTQTDELKHNPLAVGSFVYVVGEVSGIQEYGACGQMVGRIEWDSTAALPCPAAAGGATVAELHGWVTGTTKIANVELFLDGTSLGTAALTDPARTDIPSTTPVQSWRATVSLAANLGGTAAPGIEHVLRAVGTDISGTRRQFASQRVFFTPNWQNNCVSRRRVVR